MPERHSRNLRRIRVDVGGTGGHARPCPHVRHRQSADRTGGNSQDGQINQRGQNIHPISHTQGAEILGKRPMVPINLLRKRRTHQRGHRQTIHPNPKGKSLDRTARIPRPQETGNPRLTSLEGYVAHVAFQHEVTRRVVAGFFVNLVPLVAFTVGRHIGFRADGQCAQHLRGRLSNRNASRRRRGRYRGGRPVWTIRVCRGELCGRIAGWFRPVRSTRGLLLPVRWENVFRCLIRTFGYDAHAHDNHA